MNGTIWSERNGTDGRKYGRIHILIEIKAQKREKMERFFIYDLFQADEEQKKV